MKRTDKPRAALAQELDAARQRIAELEGILARDTPSLEVHARTFAQLLQLSQTLNSSEDIDSFLNQAVRSAVFLVAAADSGSIQLLDADGETVRTVAGTAMGSGGQGATVFKPGVGVAGAAIAARRVVNVADVTEDPRFIHAGMPRRVRSLVVAPLIYDDRVLGALSLSSAQAAAFTSTDEALAELIADEVVIALENARLIARLRDAEERLRKLNAALERSAAERATAFERERALSLHILDALGEGVYYTDAAGKILYVNPALCALIGYEADELVGQHTSSFRSLAVSEAQFHELRNQVLEETERAGTVRGEVVVRRKDGAEFDAEYTISKLGEGLEGRYVVVMRDVSQVKALQAQKDRFIAHVSHELRTPLSNIITRLYLTRRQPEQQDTHLDAAEEAARRMRRLIEDILDVARLEHGSMTLQRERVVVQDLIDDVFKAERPHAASKAIAFTCEAPEEPLFIYADPARMTQVISNLVVNAINYTPSGGAVTVQAHADGAFTVIDVRDTGPGIPADMLPQLFTPFFRAGQEEKGGTGLGLTIAREIVEAHGGTISVESEVGRGSAFTVRLALMGRAP
ncbi:MAG: ATP-binding protein [Anaerolineae bacterium]|nr:ATP-binding protein [Anaerolineae bacterium]